MIQRELADETSLKIAEAYVAEGRSHEAIEFFLKAGADEQLETIVHDAIEAGDAFLVQSVVRATGSEIGPEQWLRCAEAAQAQGKFLYADVARRQASRTGNTSD